MSRKAGEALYSFSDRVDTQGINYEHANSVSTATKMGISCSHEENINYSNDKATIAIEGMSQNLKSHTILASKLTYDSVHQPELPHQ